MLVCLIALSSRIPPPSKYYWMTSSFPPVNSTVLEKSLPSPMESSVPAMSRFALSRALKLLQIYEDPVDVDRYSGWDVDDVNRGPVPTDCKSEVKLRKLVCEGSQELALPRILSPMNALKFQSQLGMKSGQKSLQSSVPTQEITFSIKGSPPRISCWFKKRMCEEQRLSLYAK